MTDLSLLMLAVIWGVNFVVMKSVMLEVPPMALNALRFPLASVALGFFLMGQRGPRVPRREDVLPLIGLGVLGNVLYQLAFVFALDWTLAGNASVLLATTPMWVLILSWVMGHEAANATVALGVAGTFGGMVMVVLGQGKSISLGAGAIRGDLLMVAAALLWAFYTVGARHYIMRYGSVQVTTWTVWIGTPILILLGVPSVATLDLGAISLPAWLGIAYAGLFSLGLAYLLWYRGVQRLGSSRTAIYSNLVPVAALTTAWIWLDEQPGAVQLSGAAVVLMGLWVARRGAGRQLPDPSSRRWRTSGNS
ncbi:MAG: DMT family transporter [Gemmatimonadota bacterium]|nr:DMT family transporter [Gemmatimonadota bacterium]